MKLADIKEDVRGLPLREQVRLISEAFRASPEAQEARRKAFEATAGCLSEETGRAMEESLWWGRQLIPETKVDFSDSE